MKLLRWMLLNDSEGVLNAYPGLPIHPAFDTEIKPLLMQSDWIIDVEIKSNIRNCWFGMWGMFSGQFGNRRTGYNLECLVVDIATAADARMYVGPASNLGFKIYSSLKNLGFVSIVEFDTEYLIWSKK